MLKRILALDVGDVRIGVAVSDLLGITAQGVEIYTRTGDDKADAQYIANIAKKYDVSSIIFGLPKNMDGTEGFQVEKVREFAAAIAEISTYEHIYIDERLTTVSAKRVLHEGRAGKNKVKGAVDKIAAVIILQGYLDGH